MMNEDYSFSSSSGSSHLFGASLFVPTSGSPVKLTAEFTDSIATRTPFSFGNFIYGYTYNNYQYPDGMRYRGRTLGFSLDTDSTLSSLQGSWSDGAGRFYELNLHHATIGNRHSIGSNIVSTRPVALNLAEARVSFPLALFGQGTNGAANGAQGTVSGIGYGGGASGNGTNNQTTVAGQNGFKLREIIRNRGRDFRRPEPCRRVVDGHHHNPSRLRK
jgi:hypothetical protein